MSHLGKVYICAARTATFFCVNEEKDIFHKKSLMPEISHAHIHPQIFIRKLENYRIIR